jgi:formylglycine-generating enzyme required for sulfatase activity
VLPQRLAQLGFRAQEHAGGHVILPPLCNVPAGEFLMGSDPGRDQGTQDRETPQHRVSLTAYRIARFPVTVADYACFVRSGRAEPRSSYNLLTWRQQLTRLDHPAVNVSSVDAVAYAAWLTEAIGQPWRLPTEAEWEKAARGPDGRIYPWGDGFDVSRCDTVASAIGATTPVGSYSSGVSPCGAHDMTGNVWEWTSSLCAPYPYVAGDGREDPTSSDPRVLRGGSWPSDPPDARPAYRYDLLNPDFLIYVFGFRLVCTGPGSA